jgi:hypothetical protein
MAYNYDPFDPYQLRQQSMMGNIGMGNVGADMTQGVNPFQTLPTNPNVPDMSAAYNAPQPQQPQQPQQNPDDLSMQRQISLMNQFFPQNTASQDRFNSLLNAPPQMNTPSTARKLVAGLGSMGQYNKQTGMFTGGGPEQAEKIMYEPYLRDLAQWKEQVGPNQQAATIENQANNINRQAGSTMVNAQVASERAAQQEEAARRRAEETNRHNQETEANARRKADIMDLKRSDPTWKFETSADGTIYAFNEKNPTQKVNTGVKGTDLTDTQKALLGIMGQAYVETIRGQNQVTTKETPPGVAEKDPTGKQVTDQQQIAWKQMHDSSAPGSEWLIRGDDGVFDLKTKPVVGERKSLFGGTYTQQDLDNWQKAYDAAYPTKKSAPQTQTQTQTGGNEQPSGFRTPSLPFPSTKGLYKIGQTESKPSIVIPGSVDPNAPKKGDKVGIDWSGGGNGGGSDQHAGVQSGALVQVQGPDGKLYTVPAQNVDKMLADPKYKGFRRVQ